ncbi:hypothetical protein [Hymenobacter armeniacus]|uniref:Uncharacterized protein n=1 Tax=Hymenobacter armeniacus TaxID=2771358 RepID=A0ABR8JT06_9BACT|nr:hypothetical protein [Hymenobacter armeniacus]MBD2723105.1 hypothetical protein [Hymenobacter armeniacus]
MNVLKKLTPLALAALTTFSSCERSAEPAPRTAAPQGPLTQNTTDFMTDDFDAGWTKDLEGGSWWWQSAAGINWAIIHSTATQKGRAEVSRFLTRYNGVDNTVTIKGKFKMETTADGYENLGGWILQSMAWSFQDPAGVTQYKPLVVARMLKDRVDYLVYDYEWDANNHPVPKPGYPIIKNLKTGVMAGQTIELALKINFSKGSTGFVQANLDGVNMTAANYSGVTYPTIFPSANQQIQWKGGCYASYVGAHNAKIGLYYLYTDAY